MRVAQVLSEHVKRYIGIACRKIVRERRQVFARMTERIQIPPPHDQRVLAEIDNSPYQGLTRNGLPRHPAYLRIRRPAP